MNGNELWGGDLGMERKRRYGKTGRKISKIVYLNDKMGV